MEAALAAASAPRGLDVGAAARRAADAEETAEAPARAGPGSRRRRRKPGSARSAREGLSEAERRAASRNERVRAVRERARLCAEAKTVADAKVVDASAALEAAEKTAAEADAKVDAARLRAAKRRAENTVRTVRARTNRNDAPSSIDAPRERTRNSPSFASRTTRPASSRLALTSADAAAIRSRFEMSESSLFDALRETRERTLASHASRVAKEEITLAEWHKRGGGSRPRQKARHAPGRYVATLMRGYREHVFSGGGDGLRPEEALAAFNTAAEGGGFGPAPARGPAAAAKLRGDRRLGWLPEMEDADAYPGVARSRMAKRHARERRALEKKLGAEEASARAGRDAREAAFVGKAVEEAMAARRREHEETLEAARVGAKKETGGGEGDDK